MSGVVIPESVVRLDCNGGINTQNDNCDEHAFGRELYDFCERHATLSRVLWFYCFSR